MATEAIHPLLIDQFPEVARELEAALRREGEHWLADSVTFTRIYGPCECSDTTCGSFYTGPKPDGAFGPGHRCIPLDPSVGMMIIDVVDDVIRYVELIDRPDVHAALRRAGLHS